MSLERKLNKILEVFTKKEAELLELACQAAAEVDRIKGKIDNLRLEQNTAERVEERTLKIRERIKAFLGE